MQWRRKMLSGGGGEDSMVTVNDVRILASVSLLTRMNPRFLASEMEGSK